MAKQTKGDVFSAQLGGALYLRGNTYGIRETGGQLDFWINSGIFQAAMSIISTSEIRMGTAGSFTLLIGGQNTAGTAAITGNVGSQFGSAINVNVTAGANTNTTTANLAGALTLRGGAHASNNAAALGGDATLGGGNQTHASGVARGGNVLIVGGNATGSGAGGAISITGGTSGSGTAGHIAFTTAGSERARILPTGHFQISNQGELRLLESASTNYVALRASTSMSTDYTITLPDTAPAAHGALVYDGSNYIWQNVYSDQAIPTGQNSSTNLDVDWDDGLTQIVYMTDDWVQTLSNPRDGNPHTLIIVQDSTPHSITWDSDVDFGTLGAPDISLMLEDQFIVVTLLYSTELSLYIGSYAGIYTA